MSAVAVFVFDAYVEREATIQSSVPLPADIVVVTDNALVTTDEMPNPDDYVTVAGPSSVLRGKIVQHAYVIQLAGEADT